jgi:nitrogen regulatory protein P-II 1
MCERDPARRLATAILPPLEFIKRRAQVKKVEATIQQHKLAEVKDALHEKGVEGVTVIGGHYVGGETRKMTYRGVSRTRGAIPCVRVEVIVSDHNVNAVIDALLQHARTGTSGDGRIVVSGVASVIRIRTGETETSDAEIIPNQVAAAVVPSEQSRWDVPSYQHSW